MKEFIPSIKQFDLLADYRKVLATCVGAIWYGVRLRIKKTDR